MKEFLFLAVVFLGACSGADGAAGKAGIDGTDGSNGSSCHVEDNGDGTATVSCDDGSEATIGTANSAVAGGAGGTTGSTASACHVKDNGNGTVTISCDDGTQATVSNGQPGKNGIDGSSATATTITESFFCNGGLEGTALGFSYNAVLLTSGDLFITAAISSPLNSASMSAFYAPTQNGYQTAAVSLRYDVDGTADGGWWSLSLDRSTLIAVIQYSQSDPGPVTQKWTMLPSNCVHNHY